MKRDIINTMILAGCFLLLFGIAELLYHKLKVKVEITRKLVHMVTGLLALLFPVMLGNHWLVLLLSILFAIILFISLRYKLLQSINAIDRDSVGSLAYPFAVYASYLVYDYFHQQYVYFYMPVLVLAVCDPVAALSGKRWPIGKYSPAKESKTLMGSTMFFISAFLLILLLQQVLHGNAEVYKKLITALIIALVSTIAEAVTKKGYDNLAIPATVIAGLVFIDQIT
jgi:phytol kinase